MDVFHGDVHQFAGRTDIMNGYDMRMSQRRDNAPFVDEPFQEVLVISVGCGDRFQHDLTPQRFLNCEIHDSHAAAPDRPLNFETRNFHGFVL